MNNHSKILVHWTGKKDIENNPENNRAQLYVDRLKDYYQYGLYMKRTEEDVLRGLKIKYLLRLCFTEIRLSQAREHANNYGNLGIGFSRDFILDRGGRPVIYIPFNAKRCLLEENLKQAYNKSKGIDEIHKPLKYVLAFTKRMVNEQGDNHYDEMEWRIVHDENPNDLYIVKDICKDAFRFKFLESDIKVIVFPDEETKKISLNDEDIKVFFSRYTPITVTLDDCDNF